MEVRFNPPADRGVTTLMYVGDDDAIEKVTQQPGPREIGLGLLGLGMWLSRSGGFL